MRECCRIWGVPMLRSKQHPRVCQLVNASAEILQYRKGLGLDAKPPIPALYVPFESLNECVLVAFHLKDLDGLVRRTCR